MNVSLSSAIDDKETKTGSDRRRLGGFAKERGGPRRFFAGPSPHNHGPLNCLTFDAFPNLLLLALDSNQARCMLLSCCVWKKQVDLVK